MQHDTNRCHVIISTSCMRTALRLAPANVSQVYRRTVKLTLLAVFCRDQQQDNSIRQPMFGGPGQALRAGKKEESDCKARAGLAAGVQLPRKHVEQYKLLTSGYQHMAQDLHRHKWHRTHFAKLCMSVLF